MRSTWRRDELAYDGLSVSLLTRPLERYDIEREETRRESLGRHPRPLPWQFAELPQLVIRVGYAAVKANAAPRQPPEILDTRAQPDVTA